MSEKAPQSFANHGRFVTGYHYVLSTLLLLIAIGAGIALYRAFYHESGRTVAVVLGLMTIAQIQLFWYSRVFALKAQDRAIRAEENLRHLVLANTLLDPRLSTRQIIGLRFASDGELVELAARAAEEGMSEKDIKQAVKNWRADTYRV